MPFGSSQIFLVFFTFALLGAQSSADVKKDDVFFGASQGCFLLYNMKTGKFDQVIGEENCKVRHSPCSTFKVPLAVMAFDSGILKDEMQILKWDGVKDSREVANKDHDARSWMKDSIVWFSQRLTPLMGKEKFQSYVDKFEYGNKDLSAGIKESWLVSPAADGPALKISGYEQIEFMKKLWTGKLPSSPRATKLTQEITFLEMTPKGYSFSGKTGSNSYGKNSKKALGWFISHIQKGDEEYLTAGNFLDVKPAESTDPGGFRMKEITKQILIQKGLW